MKKYKLFLKNLDEGRLLCLLVISIVVWVTVVVVISATGESTFISHTFHPVDFSPGFASSINLQFSVEQSHDALQIENPFGDVRPANNKTILSKMAQFHVIRNLMMNLVFGLYLVKKFFNVGVIFLHQNMRQNVNVKQYIFLCSNT